MPIVLASGTMLNSKLICCSIGTMSEVPVMLRPGSSFESANFAPTKSVTAVTTIGVSVVSFAKDTAAGVAMPNKRSGEAFTRRSLILFKLS